MMGTAVQWTKEGSGKWTYEPLEHGPPKRLTTMKVPEFLRKSSHANGMLEPFDYVVCG